MTVKPSVEITSKDNPLIKKIISLGDRKARREFKEYVVEGTKPVDDCISSACEISAIVCTRELSGRYPQAIVVPEQLFGRISSEKAPQGVLAVVKLPDLFLAPPEGKCLLLDRIRDPGNLGTVIRTANAAGYGEIYCVNCTDAYSPKAVRASMSGIFHVKVYAASEDEILSALDGVTLVCADMGGEDIFSFVPPEKFCVCIGNEGNGLSENIRNRADVTVAIPMRSTCESLNAGVSAGIAMYVLNNNRKRRN